VASAELRVTLHSDVARVDASTGSLPISVTVENTYKTSITACVWNSPLDKSDDILRADMFEVVHSSGIPAQYTGILEKRLLVLSDFITLNPGQSTTVTLDLLKGYWFPVMGDYKIALSTTIRAYKGIMEVEELVKKSLAKFSREELTSDPISVELVGLKPAPVWGTPVPQSNVGGPTPKTNCNSTAASEIRTSGTNAISATQRGYNYLNTACTTSKTYYIDWFGACDTTRYNTVRTNLNAVYNGLNANYPVDCAGSSCSANTYAYVFPTDTTHTIYVCAVFWKVSSANCVMDSKPGTLIHEMSHFNNVAGTKDVTYGITNCRNLARTNPAQAITNADNYCFYTDSCSQ